MSRFNDLARRATAHPGTDDLRMICATAKKLEEQLEAFLDAHPDACRCPVCAHLEERGSSPVGPRAMLVALHTDLWAYAGYIDQDRPHTQAEIEDLLSSAEPAIAKSR